MTMEDGYNRNGKAIDLHYGVRNLSKMDNGLDLKRLLVEASLSLTSVASKRAALSTQLGLDGHSITSLNGIGSRIDHAETPPYELQLREQCHLGRVAMSISNQIRLAGIKNMIALEQEKGKILAGESGGDLSHSGSKMNDFGESDTKITHQLLGPSRIHGNQLDRSNELSSDTEMMLTGMDADGVPMTASINDLHNRMIAREAELEKSILMVRNQELLTEQLDRLPKTIGINNRYNENRVREESTIRQRELLMNRLNALAAPPIHADISRMQRTKELLALSTGTTHSIVGAMMHPPNSIHNQSLHTTEALPAAGRSHLSPSEIESLKNLHKL